MQRESAKTNTDYELMDSGDFEKLERFGSYLIQRPAPGAVWKKSNPAKWSSPDAVFERYSDGKGEWVKVSKRLPESWEIEFSGFKMSLERTSFGHLGVFPEQSANWKRFQELCSKLEKPKILNLFAYTGGATLACANAKAEVVHVDASKTSVEWAKQNAHQSGLSEAVIRYFVDDVTAFVQREIRRENKYDGIILDPPSYGRGTKSQVWKIEEHLIPLLDSLKQLKSDRFSFISLSSHSGFYSPVSLENLLRGFSEGRKGKYLSEEMLLTGSGYSLPSGATALFHT